MTKQLEKTAKIVAVKSVKDLTFTEGSAVHKRARAVLGAKTVGEALKRGARTSTVRWAVAKRFIKLGAV